MMKMEHTSYKSAWCAIISKNICNEILEIKKISCGELPFPNSFRIIVARTVLEQVAIQLDQL